MADEDKIDPTLSEELVVPDPRGEDLASDHLPEGSPYTIAPDEDEAEELTGGASVAARPAVDEDDVETPYVDDPEQLAEAEAEVEQADDTTPVVKSKRPTRRPKSAGATIEPLDEIEDAPSTGGLVAASTLRPKKRSAEVAKKDHATPRQRSGAAKPEGRKHATPAQFVKESVAELRKVVWPTGSQLSQYFVVVLVFVLFIIAFVMGLDFLFGWLLLKFLG